MEFDVMQAQVLQQLKPDNLEEKTRVHSDYRPATPILCHDHTTTATATGSKALPT